MELRNVVILVLVVAIGSAGITRYYFPKVQSQTVETTKEVVRTDVHTVVRFVERPDGSKETVTEIVDHSTKHETSTNSQTTFARKDWFLGVGASTELKQLEPIYNVQVNRRILGPFYVGAQATTHGEVGLNLGMEF